MNPYCFQNHPHIHLMQYVLGMVGVSCCVCEYTWIIWKNSLNYSDGIPFPPTTVLEENPQDKWVNVTLQDKHPQSHHIENLILYTMNQYNEALTATGTFSVEFFFPIGQRYSKSLTLLLQYKSAPMGALKKLNSKSYPQRYEFQWVLVHALAFFLKLFG